MRYLVIVLLSSVGFACSQGILERLGGDVIARGVNSKGTVFVELDEGVSGAGVIDALREGIKEEDFDRFVLVYPKLDGTAVVYYIDGSLSKPSVRNTSWQVLNGFLETSYFYPGNLELSIDDGRFLGIEVDGPFPRLHSPSAVLPSRPTGRANTCDYTSSSTGTRYICYNSTGQATYENRCTVSFRDGAYDSNCSTREW